MSIIGSLPYNMVNGQTADATQVMADFNTIVNAVNNATTGAASIPQVQTNSLRYAADTGTVNAIIIGVSPSPALTDGMEFTTKVANTNTSTTVTVQVGSGTAKGVVIDQAGTLPSIGSMILGMYYKFTYSSSLDKYVLMNPSRATGSFTGTLTGTGGTTLTVNYAISQDGEIVYFWMNGSSTGTSSNTSLTMTGVPSALSPTTGKTIAARVTDNGTTVAGVMDTGTSTTWTFHNGYTASTSTFTASGPKGLQSFSGSFTKD